MKKDEAESLFYNYKMLDQIANEEEELMSYYHLDESDEAYARLQKKLLLKSLSIILIKKDLNCLTQQIIKYYRKGISYYISWSIMLSILLGIHNQELDFSIIDLLLDIENNNYYGVKNLEETLKEYWHKFNKP